MALNHFVASLVTFLVLSSCAYQAHASIVITSNAGSSVWWLAFAVNDPATTAVELKDSGAYSTWTALQKTDWGFWTFSTTGTAVTFPISFRLSAGSQQLVINNAFSSPAPGTAYDTKQSFAPASSGASTQAPTTKPTTAPSSAPTTKPTTAPTQAPTQKPTTAPTQAPTTKPTTAPTQAPTQKPTTAPTSAPTTKPTTAPTSAPTTKPTTAPTSAPTAKPTTAPTSAPSTGNPFANSKFYLNPLYSIEVDSSIAANPAKSAQLSKVKTFATGVWLSGISQVDNLTTVLTQARQQSTSSGKSVLVTIVVYNLPARDCAAGASNGEIQCADAACANGITTYKNSYIGKIMNILRNFQDVQVAAIVEPDSLPNLATNLGYPKCVLAQNAYTTGVTYAIQQLSSLSNVHIYLDAAHGGWLGWDTGRNAFANVVNQVVTAAGGKSKIRGFATNVANYQALGSMTDTADPCKLASQYNFAINEVKYVSLLDQSMNAVGLSGMHYIIDTGRNGVPNSRTSCSNWCNIKNAGLGVPPTSNTASSGLNIIDAYFWVKPPGESDGTSDAGAQRYDATCSSVDSMIPAPEAGNWFSAYLVNAVNNANPPL